LIHAAQGGVLGQLFTEINDPYVLLVARFGFSVAENKTSAKTNQ
jgi:hypothetical protein